MKELFGLVHQLRHAQFALSRTASRSKFPQIYGAVTHQFVTKTNPRLHRFNRWQSYFNEWSCTVLNEHRKKKGRKYKEVSVHARSSRTDAWRASPEDTRMTKMLKPTWTSKLLQVDTILRWWRQSTISCFDPVQVWCVKVPSPGSCRAPRGALEQLVIVDLEQFDSQDVQIRDVRNHKKKLCAFKV